MSYNYLMQNVVQENRANNQHFFDASTMRFFHSRIYYDTARKIGDITYFVTSEQFDWTSPRLYTLRAWDHTTKRMDTIGEFQEFDTRAKAVAVITKLRKQAQGGK